MARRDSASEDGFPEARNPREMLLALRNRNASAATLAAVAGDERWNRHHQIRVALVRHPKTPLSVSTHLVGHLYWKELAETAIEPSTHPVVRRRAEDLLVARIDELSGGEKIALARRASRRLVIRLLEVDDDRVLAAVLDGPRAVEADVMTVLDSRNRSAELVERLAGHPRWSFRRDVILGIVAHPATPVSRSLKLLHRLDVKDLRRLAENDKVPKIVRVGADRRLSLQNTTPAPADPPVS